MSDFIKFLGTAGARFVTAKQLRSSAGTYIELSGKRIMLDPGPGTLVKCASSIPRIDPEKLDAVILSHGHIDHSTDVNVLIDAMTGGGLRRKGMLFAPSDCLEGRDMVILEYLKHFPEAIVPLEADTVYSIGDVRFRTSPRHLHGPETYGLKFSLGEKLLSFLVDGKFSHEITRSYRGTEILVLNAVLARPIQGKDVLHLTLYDVRNIIPIVKPKKAILTHFGTTMLRAGPREIAENLTEELGVEVIAAKDGMTIEI